MLLALSLVYYAYLEQTHLSAQLQTAACVVLLVGILAQSGGFFLDLDVAEGRQASRLGRT